MIRHFKLNLFSLKKLFLQPTPRKGAIALALLVAGTFVLPTPTFGFSCSALFSPGKSRVAEIRERLAEIHFELIDLNTELAHAIAKERHEDFGSTFGTKDSEKLGSQIRRLEAERGELESGQAALQRKGDTTRGAALDRNGVRLNGHARLVLLSESSGVSVAPHIAEAIGAAFQSCESRLVEIGAELNSIRGQRLSKQPFDKKRQKKLEREWRRIKDTLENIGKRNRLTPPHSAWRDGPVEFRAKLPDWIKFLGYKNRIFYATIPHPESGYAFIKTLTFHPTTRDDGTRSFSMRIRATKTEAHLFIDALLGAFEKHADSGSVRVGAQSRELIPIEWGQAPIPEHPFVFGMNNDLIKVVTSSHKSAGSRGRKILGVNDPNPKRISVKEGKSLVTISIRGETRESLEENTRDLFDSLVHEGLIHLIH